MSHWLATDETQSTTTSTTFQEKLKHTFDTTGKGSGDYKVTVSWQQYNTDDEAGKVEVQLELDDTTNVFTAQEGGGEDSSSYLARTMVCVITGLSGASHDLDLDYRKVSEGTAKIKEVTILVERL